MTLNSCYILYCRYKSQFFLVENVTIIVRREGINFDYSMSLLKMSLSGREGGVKTNLANVTKFTVFSRGSLPLKGKENYKKIVEADLK